MPTTTNLNLWRSLSWLQSADNDVWLYLYNNYLVPVLNSKMTHSEIHRPRHFKRMFEDLKRNCYDPSAISEARSYCKYLAGRYSISHGSDALKTSQNLYLCGIRLQSEGWVSEWRRTWEDTPFSVNMNNISKDQCIEKCKELDIHYRKSWTKGKIIKAMLNHEDN